MGAFDQSLLHHVGRIVIIAVVFFIIEVGTGCDPELGFCAIQGNYTGDPVRIPLWSALFSILKDLFDCHIIGVDMVNDSSGVDIIAGNTVVIIA